MAEQQRHPAMMASAILGAAGVVLILAGIVTGTGALNVVGFVLGALSLGAALYWRSELIEAWRAERGPSRQRRYK